MDGGPVPKRHRQWRYFNLRIFLCAGLATGGQASEQGARATVWIEETALDASSGHSAAANYQWAAASEPAAMQDDTRSGSGQRAGTVALDYGGTDASTV